MNVKLLKSITLWGKEIPEGEVVEVNDESAEALVREGAAEFEGQEIPKGDQPPAVDPIAAAAAEADKQKKALDAQYKRDDLAEAAKEAGVEFPYDAKKADIIEAVVAAGKASVLLQ